MGILRSFYHIYRNFGFEWVIYVLIISAGVYALSGSEKKAVTGRAFAALCTIATVLLLPANSLLPYVPVFATQGAAIWSFFIVPGLILTAALYLFLRPFFLNGMVYTLFYLVFILLFKMVCSSFYALENELAPDTYMFLDLLLTAVLIVLLLFLTRLFERARFEIRVQMHRRLYLLACFFPLSFFIYFIAYVSGAIQSDNLARSLLSLVILLNIPVIYMIFAAIAGSYREREELHHALEETHAQLSRYRYSIEMEDRLRRERHELKNRYLYMQLLLKEEKYDTLKTYLDEAAGELTDAGGTVSTGNTMLDYILNKKMSEARRRHLPFCTEISVSAKLGVPEDVLCTVLLNLLDNAIEGSASCREPDIHVSIREMQNYILCTVRNRTDQDVLAVNPNLKSTKKDASRHGFGTRIVKTAVEEANGSIRYEADAKTFTVTFMLPQAAAKEDG